MNDRHDEHGSASALDPVEGLSYTEASHELDEIVAFFEQREIDVDQLVSKLERATAIVDELDRRLRRTRVQVEELVPRLEAAAAERDPEPEEPNAAPPGVEDGTEGPVGGSRRRADTGAEAAELF